MKLSRVLTPPSLFLAVFALSCGSEVDTAVGPEGVPPRFAPGGACTPWPACKNDGGSGGPGGGGEPDYKVTLGDALGGTGDAQGTKDNKKYLTVESELYEVSEVDFGDVAVLDVEGVDDNNVCGIDVDPLECACIFNGSDALAGIDTDPSGGDVQAQVIAHLRAVLTATDIERRFIMQIHKRTLGEQHHDNILGLRALDETEGNLLANATTLKPLTDEVIAWFGWGRNTPSTGDFMQADGDANSVNDQNAERTFTLSKGTVRMLARLGSSGSDPLVSLVCDVPDAVSATATVCPAEGCP
jgi:hypothetical protein